MIQAIVQGCKAGALAGLIWGTLLLGFVSPLIQHAEVYEEQGAIAQVVEAPAIQAGPESHPHHDEGYGQEFQPNTWQRPLLTLLGTELLGIAFGILVSVALSLGQYGQGARTATKRQIWQTGLLIGLTGFAIFHAIPAIGLRPALPGILGAEEDHAARQSWWLLSVTCSSIAVLLVSLLGSYARKAGLRYFGSLLVLAGAIFLYPFLGFGVPHYSVESVTPLELQRRFIWVSLSVSGAFWLVMGTSLAHFLGKQRRLGF